MKQKKENSKREKNKHNAVIYTRVSAWDQNEKENKALEFQKDSCHSYARKNKMKVVKVYEERGHNQESLKDLLNFLENKVDAVVSFLLIHNLRRITYNSSFAFYVALELERHGVQLISVGEKIRFTPHEFKMYCFELLRKDVK